MSERHDILIVGGGLVGASLAIALDAAGCDVALAEAVLAPPATEPSYGERNLALARATCNGLDAIGVWPRVASRATPIRRVCITRAGAFGSLHLQAAELGVDNLGCTLPARELGLGLHAGLAACSRLTRYAPARLTTMSPGNDAVRAVLALPDGGNREVEARLLVGADGSESMLRRLLGIEAVRHDYAQILFVCTVQPSRDLDGQAFERFGDDGPTALLPLAEGRAGLVLTARADEADAVAMLDDDAFLALAMRRLGGRVGRLSRPGPRHRHRIERVLANTLVGPRAVLVGNAAQTVHPIGAQGFNLGLRDALTLAEMVVGAADPGDAVLLRDYAARRAPDRDGVVAFSHGMVQLACGGDSLLTPWRTLALGAMNLPPLRRAMARRGMGFRGVPPRAVLEDRP